MSELGTVSVVVASFRDLAILEQCLDSLRPQCRALGAELLVARASRETAAELDSLAEGCRIAPARADASVPELRGVGLAAARGEWVAITEDHCVADPKWLATLLAARQPGVQVLGGRMGNARRERSTDCGAFFAEYGFYGITPGCRRAGVAPLVTQANAAYHRSVLADIAQWARAGSWENVIHDRLFAAGRRFALVPEARIYQNLHYGLGAFCRDRYRHGRAYGATRAKGLPAGRRALLLAGTPLLPAVLGSRIYRCVDPAERRYWWRGFPAMFAFLSAWAVGEAAGYVRGGAA